MKKRTLALFLTILFTLLPLFGCRDISENGNTVAAPVNDTGLHNPDLNPQTAAGVAQDANDFAFRLSAALAQELGDENLIVSPYSVWLPLAALLNATTEAHINELLEALGIAGISVDDVNRAAARMLFSLNRESARQSAEENDWLDEFHNPLRIVNAIFVDDSVRLRQNFAQIFMDYFRGAAFNVNFSSQIAVDAVNTWAYEQTNGLIRDIIEEFSPYAIVAIANAIYFSDRWSWEFSPSATIEDIFHAPSGETTAHFMVRQGDGQFYFEDAYLQATQLRFTHGGGMMVLLPRDGDANNLLAGMTNQRFEQIRADGDSDATGRLLLPRFSLENRLDGLGETLDALGVPLFNPLTGPTIGGLIESGDFVRLGQVVQKSVIEVDEKGTTAAAVTVMEAVNDGIPEEPEPAIPFEMICDRPFVFVLYQWADGGAQVLFTGAVNQP